MTGSPPPRPQQPPPRRRPEAPSREAIALLPPFAGLELAQITVVADAAGADAALPLWMAETVLGFDTESKPTFAKGAESDGPHVVQFAARDHAWVVQLHDAQCRAAVASVLMAETVRKVGFGLDNDRKAIQRAFGTLPAAVLDLDTVFRRQGFRNSIGVKGAIAVLLGQRFAKSKKTSTSNWALPRLGPAQVRYAGNDAWAALQVYAALQQRSQV